MSQHIHAVRQAAPDPSLCRVGSEAQDMRFSREQAPGPASLNLLSSTHEPFREITDSSWSLPAQPSPVHNYEPAQETSKSTSALNADYDHAVNASGPVSQAASQTSFGMDSTLSSKYGTLVSPASDTRFSAAMALTPNTLTMPTIDGSIPLPSPSFPRRPISSADTRSNRRSDFLSAPTSPGIQDSLRGFPAGAALWNIRSEMKSPHNVAAAAANDQRTQLHVRNLPYSVRWQDVKDLFRRAGTVLRADVHLTSENRSCGSGTVLFATEEDAFRAMDALNGYMWQGRVLEVSMESESLSPSRRGFQSSHQAEPSSGVPAQRGPNASDETYSRPMAQPSIPAHAAHIHHPSYHPSQLPSNSLPDQSQANRTHALPPIRIAPYVSNRSEYPMDLNWGSTHLPPAAPVQHPVLPSLPFPGRVLFIGNLPFHCQWQDLKDLFRAAGNIQRADVALNADGRSRGFGTVLFASPEDAQNAVRLYHGYEFNGRALKVHFDRLAHYGPVHGVPSEPSQYTSAFAKHTGTTSAQSQTPIGSLNSVSPVPQTKLSNSDMQSGLPSLSKPSSPFRIEFPTGSLTSEKGAADRYTTDNSNSNTPKFTHSALSLPQLASTEPMEASWPPSRLDKSSMPPRSKSATRQELSSNQQSGAGISNQRHPGRIVLPPAPNAANGINTNTMSQDMSGYPMHSSTDLSTLYPDKSLQNSDVWGTASMSHLPTSFFHSTYPLPDSGSDPSFDYVQDPRHAPAGSATRSYMFGTATPSEANSELPIAFRPTANLPPTPHWSQPIRTRAEAPIFTPAALDERIQQTPGAAPYRHEPNPNALAVGGIGSLRSSSVSSHGYPFPNVPVDTLPKTSVEKPRDSFPVTEQVADPQELNEGIATLNIHAQDKQASNQAKSP
ncbi:hypothetical protein MYAM1_002406 [Malassezia yamatoensis]|uniref:RRM domain-containing protein n=1 Tax=Malassezia yamatoensis TaxID=253288 RepID=A0AAJ5YTU9_9BASI|nr:hypothetical protein MYAM1_002406 [Malassezia yamatoensis]